MEATCRGCSKEFDTEDFGTYRVWCSARCKYLKHLQGPSKRVKTAGRPGRYPHATPEMVEAVREYFSAAGWRVFQNADPRYSHDPRMLVISKGYWRIKLQVGNGNNQTKWAQIVAYTTDNGEVIVTSGCLKPLPEMKDIAFKRGPCFRVSCAKCRVYMVVNESLKQAEQAL